MSSVKSTPIHNLPSNDSDETNENTQLINEILKELESDTSEQRIPPQEQAMSHQEQRIPPQYQAMPQQEQRIPPQYQAMPQQEQRASPQYQEQAMPQQEQQYIPPQQNTLQEDSMELISDILSNEDDVELSQNDKLDNALQLTEDSDLNTLIVMELKRPLIIILLSIVFSLPAFNRSLLSFIPKLANDVGNMNLFGIIVKSILVGLLYYVLDKSF